MQPGQVEAVTANGVLATISPATNASVETCVVHIITSAGFDGTITFKKRLNRANTPNGTQNIAQTACAYEKQVDKTIATAAIAPGASATLIFSVDITSCDLMPEMSGRTAGSVSLYWNVVNG